MTAAVRLILAMLLLASAAGEPCIADEQANTLWYKKPAGKWTEALPLGNGRLGAMVFGSVSKERLQLNEESLWAGELEDPVRPGAVETWRKVRKLILEEKILEARKLAMDELTISPTSYRSYEPLADLWIELEHGDPVKDYRRQLDMETGLVRIEYSAAGVLWTREVFVSAVDDVVAVRLTADKSGAINARITLTRKKDVEIVAKDNSRLNMDGQIVDVAAPDAYDDNRGGSGRGGAHMKFAGRLRVRTQAGTVRGEKGAITIKNADEVVLLFTGATDYNVKKMTFDRTIDPAEKAESILDAASRKTWAQLYADHAKEHRSIFNRVSIDLGGSDARALPTDERLRAVRAGKDDPDLVALYFQFGRYLLASSSRRPGVLPANLQGIWNDRMWAPWEADYHLNINLQMNYWPADLCNLSETIEPLADWLAGLASNGAASAKRLYGADGWVAFTTVNVFGRTTPGGSTKGSQFQNGICDPLAGAWMAMTLWRHYEFTQDTDFLAYRAYPILKGACEFVLDYLIEDPDGYLVTAPSTSPENSYIHPETGQTLRLTRGSTYHNQIIRALFEAVVEASEILDTDPQFRKKLVAAVKRIPPNRIGADGTIQEWIGDYKEREPGHRHMSHLMALHPFAQITPQTSKLFAAALKTIERRLQHGGGHTGWSRAWIINFYARLRRPAEAHRHVQMLLRKSTHPNLFDNHPPFQIDGNFGGAAGIAEMLLQSHAGRIDLLPALPRAWPTGRVRGLKARGAFVVDIEWENGRLLRARIESLKGSPAAVSYADHSANFKTKPGAKYTLNAQLKHANR